ncbi:NAD(P)-binding domain-containing protein [Haloechinothrix halophila]|uniref:NAD(P)-binding domain-containing protein n=1 Tax=Haloechinothrix halophila TaxID=1069073 RepID=UPI000410ACBE|nr:NAD(P)-binding domain-containing protein [Haloechinothrix halophila]
MTDPNGGSSDHDVAVLGCGPMGAALARAFARSGYSVAAWNRTPERAEALADDGIRPVGAVDDAVASAPLIVACLTTYEATLSALDPIADWHGTTLINLATGAPYEATVMESWAAKRGAEYLDGSIVCYPQDIGTPGGAILYSGSSAAWAEHEKTLRSLAGSSAYVSEQVTDASALNVGVVGGFYVSALSAYVEAATYVLSHGVATEVLDAITQVTIDGLRKGNVDAAAAIVSDGHATDQATIDTYAEAAGAALAVMRRSGQRARLLGAAVENLATAKAAGLGTLGFTAQAKVATAEQAEAV